jgi:hypothetical protein
MLAMVIFCLYGHRYKAIEVEGGRQIPTAAFAWLLVALIALYHGGLAGALDSACTVVATQAYTGYVAGGGLTLHDDGGGESLAARQAGPGEGAW